MPIPNLTGVNKTCLNDTDLFYTDSHMSNYIWTVTGGSIFSGFGTDSIKVTWGAAGTGTITVNYTDGNGCTAAIPTSQNITINPLPFVAAIGGGPVVNTSSDMC